MTIALAVLRTLVGLTFVAFGLWKLFDHAAFVERFAHWGLPAPDWTVPVYAAIEIVCGALLALGALTRPVGLLLATLMIVALFTAGRTDGGVSIALPLVLFLLTVFFAWRSARFSRAPLRRPGVQ